MSGHWRFQYPPLMRYQNLLQSPPSLNIQETASSLLLIRDHPDHGSPQCFLIAPGPTIRYLLQSRPRPMVLATPMEMR